MSVVKFGDDPRNRQTVDRYSTSVFTDDALEYLQEERSQPFCMVVSYTVGHDAWLAPPGFAGKYAPSQVPLPPNFMTKPPFQQFNSKIRDETLLRFPRTRADVRTATAGYYAMIEHMDEHIGQLLDALQRRSLAAETLVIFLSVKGLSLGSHGILGKQTLYEEGIRTSLIVRHPKLRAASRTNSELVSTIDLLPTICEAAGVRIPASVEGQSLLGVYDGTRKGRQRLFFSYHDPNRSTVTRAVRTQRYKLIHHLLTDERQLFDLSNDPYEFKNLANLPEHQSVERDLTHALLVWRAGSEEK